MNETKSILASKTFWGSAIAAIGGIAAVFGHTIDASVTAEVAEILAIIAGAALAVYGRIKADKKIG